MVVGQGGSPVDRVCWPRDDERVSTVSADSAQVAALSSGSAGQVSGVVYGRGAPVASVGSFTLNLAGVVTAQRGQSGLARWGNFDAVAGRAGHPEGLDRPCWTGRAGAVDWSCGNDAGGRLTTAALAPAGADLRCRWGPGIPQWVGVARTPIDVDAL